jgi:hypothetical protein
MSDVKRDIVDRLMDEHVAASRTEAAEEITALRARVAEVEKRDSEAAHHVESVIAMRTGFTGDRPYVGWKGLGLALNEALDARDAAEARVTELTAQLATARADGIKEGMRLATGVPLEELPAEYDRAMKDAKP